MFGLENADLLVVAAYLVAVTWLGLRAARGVKTSAEYFMPRRFGRWALALSAFSTATSAEQAVTVASKCYSTGASGIWYQWQYLFTTPFYWIVAPLLRRLRAITTADIFEARFDRSVALLYCGVGLLKSTCTLGLMLKGTSTLLAATTAGAVHGDALIVVLTVVFVGYSFLGGWSASVITNVFQGLLTLLFSFMLVPFVWVAVGGMGGMKETLAHAPAMFSLVTPGDVSLFTIVILAIGSLVGLPGIPHNLGIATASRREQDGQFGFTVGAFIKRLCTAAWCLTGLAGAAYFVAAPINPDEVYGRLAQAFLPQLLPGLLGVFIAATLAEVMGTCSSMMNSAAALVTHNLYRHFRPDRPDRHYLLVGRVASVLVVASGVAFAFWLPGVVKGLEIVIAIGPLMGVAFWLGVFWRRTTVGGAWAATVTGLVALLVCERAGVSVGVQLAAILGSATVAGVLASLFTAPVPEAKLDNFLALMNTPVAPGERVDAPCTLPAGVVADGAKRRWRFPMDRRAWWGFAACWAAVLAMILGLWIMLRLG